MSDYKAQLRTGVVAGVKKGWSSFVWMAKIIIPISLLTALLQWSGWLNNLNFLLDPLMHLLNLPAEAALPIISGMLINIYAVIAIVSVIPFTLEQLTLIAIFNLIAHSLIMEGVVQYKSGINVVKATLVRVIAAILAVFVVSRFIGGTSLSAPLTAGAIAAQGPFLEALKAWAVGTFVLLAKVLGIIMCIMIALECLGALGWIERSLRVFRPAMKVLGLPNRTSMMFVAGIIFGLLYGGAVIVEEAKKGNVTRDELERIHISLGINHAMIEDPALFAMLGVSLLWSWLPRLTMAIIAVHTYRALTHLNHRWRRRGLAA